MIQEKMHEDLLIKYVSRQCTGEELKELQHWIAEDPRHASRLFELERIWDIKEIAYHSDPVVLQRAYNNVWQDIRGKEKRRTHFRSFSLWIKYVSVIALLITSSLWFFHIKTEDPIVSVNKVEVPVGQTSIVHLSDGTKVWLNAGSILTYPTVFSDKERMVELDGEGYFEVESDRFSPFIVNGRYMQIKVLGTRFNFRSYENEVSSVTLAEGWVSVSVDEKEIILSPDQQLSYSKEYGIVWNRDINADLICGWINGEFVFTGEKLKNIIKVLERRFRVEIHLEEESLGEEIFTCRARANIQLFQILDLLKDTRRIEYEIHENRVLILKK